MKITKELVTPKKAAEYLRHNTKNRPLRITYAQRLAEAITQGQWRINGETIKFNGDGTMVDGQHRCKAVEISGRPIETYVVRGLDHDAFDTIDQGTRRNIGDVFARHGEKNYKHLATAVRYMRDLSHYYDGDTPTLDIKSGIRPDEALVVLEMHPNLRESVQFVAAAGVRDLMSVGIAAALHYRCRQKSKANADHFWTCIGSGENLAKDTAEYTLRRLLIKHKGREQQLGRRDLIVVCCKGWNMFRSNTPCKAIACGDGEQPPVLK